GLSGKGRTWFLCRRRKRRGRPPERRESRRGGGGSFDERQLSFGVAPGGFREVEIKARGDQVAAVAASVPGVGAAQRAHLLTGKVDDVDRDAVTAEGRRQSDHELAAGARASRN